MKLIMYNLMCICMNHMVFNAHLMGGCLWDTGIIAHSITDAYADMVRTYYLSLTHLQWYKYKYFFYWLFMWQFCS